MKPLVDGSQHALVTRHDSALLDLDGVLYVGPDAVGGAPEAVAAARAAGIRVAFVTNNAARTPETVAAHLTELGVVASPEDVVTSAQAAATLVAAEVEPGAAVLVVGGEGLDAALAERGLRPVRAADDEPAAVVQGFSPDVGWRQLAEGTYAVQAGLPWIASNLDATIPTSQGMAPGNGALVGVIVRATGRHPVAAGKPETPLHEEAVRRTGAQDPLVVGDRLDTDIEGAVNAGVPSLLVLTGVSTALDLVLAAEARRPTYVSRDLSTGLLEPHPPVTREPAGWTCGGWVCTVTDGRIEVTGGAAAGDAADEAGAMDGLRAVCVAVWEAGDQPDSDEVQRALAYVGL